MKVTPLDIRRKEFKRSMRGYSDEEVDIFLDEVADEFERLFQENIEMQDRMQRLEEQIAGHAQIKDALEKTLISAQLQSDETRANARKESEVILRDAELKARNIVNDSYGEIQRVQQGLVQLKHLEEDFRFKFRSLLEGHLKLLNDAPVTLHSSEAVVVGEPVPDTETFPEGSGPELTQADLLSPVKPDPDGRPPVGGPPRRPDDDVPTEETALVDPAVPAGEVRGGTFDSPAADDVTASTGVSQEAGEEEPSAGSFFFGRRLDGGDEAFPGDETGDKEKGRDFEW